MAVLSPYEGLSAVHPASSPIHIPSGIPGEPDTAGTATIGDRTIPFPIQQDTAAEQQGWVQRMNEFDRAKKDAEKAREDEAYLKNLMMYHRAGQSAKQVENALSLQAMFNYDRDLKTGVAAGLSEQQAALQALVRNPKVLGSGFGAGVRALQPRQTLENAGPASVITDPETGQRLGVRIPTGPTGGTFRPDVPAKDKTTKLTPSQLMARARQLTDSLPMGNKPPPAVQEELNEIDRQLRTLTMPAAPSALSAPAAVQPIRVRRKSDGKTFTYPGAASDVPDKYEVLP